MGPGTELTKILESFGITAKGCSCKQVAKLMDYRGPQWCTNHIPFIIRRMKQNADKMKLRWLFSEFAARRLITMAIKRGTVPGARPLANYFERVYCVNLRRRPDRKKRVEEMITPENWPFAPIEWVPAIDGKLVRPPDHWKSGWGAWGCYRTHLRLIEQCLNDGVESVLLLEDDMVLADEFHEKVTEFLAHVPDDWGMLYLGGQHLHVNQQPPREVPDTEGHVFQPYNVNRTHAWALRGATMLATYKHLNRKDWHDRNHVDHHLGRIHMQRKLPIYCPKDWLIGQNDGKSNISGKVPPQRFWASAKRYADTKPNENVFVAVLGNHSSGSSCLAGVLYHLGVYMGDKLVGYYGTDPDKSCGFEAEGLRSLCEQIIPFPQTALKMPPPKLKKKLGTWIQQRRRTAEVKRTIAGGKYPQLSQLGPFIQATCGEQLRLVVSDRPIEESIASMLKRTKGKNDAKKVEAHLRWLEKGKEEFIARVPAEHVLRVNYSDLLRAPDREVERIIAFLKLNPTEAQIIKATEWPDPDKRHIGAEEEAVA